MDQIGYLVKNLKIIRIHWTPSTRVAKIESNWLIDYSQNGLVHEYLQNPDIRSMSTPNLNI